MGAQTPVAHTAEQASFVLNALLPIQRASADLALLGLTQRYEILLQGFRLLETVAVIAREALSSLLNR